MKTYSYPYDKEIVYSIKIRTYFFHILHTLKAIEFLLFFVHLPHSLTY